MGNLVERYDPEENRGAVVSLIVGSVIFHILLLVIFPLILFMFPKPKKFERPKTMKLVRAPQKKKQPKTIKKPKVEKPQPKVEKPQPKVEKPKPKVEKPKPIKKPKPKIEKPKKPKPKPDKPKVTKKPDKPKVTKKPEKEVEEDLSALQGMFDEKPDPMDSYRTIVINKIKKHWKPTKRNSAKYPLVIIKIRKNGAIASVAIKTSSGDKLLDKQALAAVRNAKRFPKVPGTFKGAVYPLKLRMIPNL